MAALPDYDCFPRLKQIMATKIALKVVSNIFTVPAVVAPLGVPHPRV
jgi:hypothetical protein